MTEEQENTASPVQDFADTLAERFVDQGVLTKVYRDQVTMEVPREHMLIVCNALRNEREFSFEQLSDLCGTGKRKLAYQRIRCKFLADLAGCAGDH